MKQQVLVVHGGETFKDYVDYWKYLENYEIDFEKEKTKTKRWKSLLQQNLGDDFEVVLPQMPSPRNAKYKEWKLWIEKYFPFLNDNVILVGHSLGGVFWAKYLSENTFPKKISQLHLIASPFDDNWDATRREGYNLVDFNFEPSKLCNVAKQVDNIFLYHSKDDPVVPFDDLNKYAKYLSTAQKVVFTDKGHFITDNFPEILKNITKK